MIGLCCTALCLMRHMLPVALRKQPCRAADVPDKHQFTWLWRCRSAYREQSFGHGILNFVNQTHTLFTWHRNQDMFNESGDSVGLPIPVLGAHHSAYVTFCQVPLLPRASTVQQSMNAWIPCQQSYPLHSHQGCGHSHRCPGGVQ